MNPAARLQSAIELVDEIIIAARDGGASADMIAKRFFATRRYAGSKDRRAVRDLAWNAIRQFGERPKSARSAFIAMADVDPDLAAWFDGSDYGPSSIGANEERARRGALPEWLNQRFSPLIDAAEQAALLERAPLDTRVNALKAARDAMLAEWPEAVALPQSDFALRLPAGTAVDQHPAAQSGLVEVQDLGSQIIVDACMAERGMTVLDLCAGAGGKTLALAAAMNNEGRIVASDTNRNRLDQILPRAARAEATNIETRLLNPGKERFMLADLAGQCDVVLIDAPCSGSGTWRRNPETRWRLDPARLDRVVAEQAKLLAIGAEMVAPGGHLVYAVCSIVEQEGRGQVTAFLEQHEGWQPFAFQGHAGRLDGDGTLLTPHFDGTDGFFFARLKKL